MQVHGMLSADQLLREIGQGSIDTLIVASCDMQGRLIGKRISGWYFAEHARQHGIHFCTYLLGTDIELETPKGYELMTWESGYGDYLSRPDWATARRIPWLEGTALILADVVDETTGEEIPVSPRTLLKQQVERCHALGFEPMMASELEFYLVDESFSSAKRKDYRDLTLGGDFNEDYQLLQGTRYEPFYRNLRNQLSAAGVPIEFSKGEAAVAQHELNIHYADALEAADRTVLLKHGIKEMALQDGKAVTFMAKPDASGTGSSGHVHCSLASLQTGKNLFADAGGGCPTLCAGFWEDCWRAPATLSLLIAPNINSYKRFASASWAPVYLVWSRTTAPAVSGSSATEIVCASKTAFRAAIATPTSFMPRCSPWGCTASKSSSTPGNRSSATAIRRWTGRVFRRHCARRSPHGKEVISRKRCLAAWSRGTICTRQSSSRNLRSGGYRLGTPPIF